MSKIIFKTYKAIDFCDDVRDGTHDSPKHLDFGKILITSKNIKDNYIDFTNVSYISEEDYNKINERSLVEKNDILYSMIGTVGLIYRVEEHPNYAIKNMGLFKISDELKSKWLYYYLSSPKAKKDVVSKLNGSTQKFISLNNLRGLEIRFPEDVNNAKRIIKVLEIINKKIKLNNEINNNLYEISKQLLLKYLEDNSDSEEINISELLNVFTGKKNANETSPNGKYKFFSCAPESLLSDTFLYDGAAIIVAGNGAYTGRTRFYDGKFELYQRTYGLTLKDDVNKNNIYGLYVFMKTIFEPDKMGGTHGSAIPYIVLSDLTDYKLKYNKIEFEKFSDLVSNNIKMIQENEKNNEELSQLRDTLLPKLMNGEIDLDNIEI